MNKNIHSAVVKACNFEFLLRDNVCKDCGTIMNFMHPLVKERIRSIRQLERISTMYTLVTSQAKCSLLLFFYVLRTFILFF